MKFVNRHTRAIKKTLKSLIIPVVEYLEMQSYENLDTTLQMLIDKTKVEEAYVNLYKDVGKVFGQNVREFIKNKNLQLKDMESDLWAEMMEGWCLRDCAKRIAEVYNYTIEQVQAIVRKEVAKGTAEGFSIRTISDNIRKQLPKEYGKAANWRAKRIAQTEVISASNMANIRAAEQTGLPMRKTWSTRPYGAAQSIQGERHAMLVDLADQHPLLNEDFIVDGEPLGYPGDPKGSPGNVINCFCVLTYEVI